MNARAALARSSGFPVRALLLSTHPEGRVREQDAVLHRVAEQARQGRPCEPDGVLSKHTLAQLAQPAANHLAVQVAHTVTREGGAHVQGQHLLVVGHSGGREPVGGLLLDPKISVGIERDVPVDVGREGLAGRPRARRIRRTEARLTDRPQAFDLPKLLGGVAVIDIAVDGLQQRRHSGAQRAPQGPRGGLAATAVEQAARSLRPKPGLDPLELPDGQPGARRSLLVGDLPRQGSA